MTQELCELEYTYLVKMYVLMLFQVGPWRKLFVTRIAWVWFFTRVKPFMSDQVTDLCKCFFTSLEITDVGLTVGMYSQMLLKRWILDKAWSTFRAIKKRNCGLSNQRKQCLPFIRFLASMRSNMLLQSFVATKHLLAIVYFTHKWNVVFEDALLLTARCYYFTWGVYNTVFHNVFIGV